MSFTLQSERMLARPILGFAWILAIALLSLSAATASASCGDYLHPKVEDTPAFAIANVLRTTQPSMPSVPCTGPGCQNAPAMPEMPTPVDVRSSFAEELIVEVRSPLTSSMEAQQPLDQALLLLPEGHRAGLERPPRFG